MQVKSSLDNIKPDCELVLLWEGMQENGQAESQRFSILQIIINNWYLILHFPSTQQAGWGQRILGMLFLALAACKVTPPNSELDASLQIFVFFFWCELRFSVPCGYCSLHSPILLSTTSQPSLCHCGNFPRTSKVIRTSKDVLGPSVDNWFYETRIFVKSVEKKPFWAVTFGWNHAGFRKSCGSRTAWELQEMGEGQLM